MPSQRESFEMPTFDVLDVGHGSSIVLAEGGRVVIVDTGPGAPILRYLQQEGVNEIDTVVVSHADRDHVGGLLAILGQPDIKVDRVLINPDAFKESRMWQDLAWELEARRNAGNITEVRSATLDEDVASSLASFEAVVVAPRLTVALIGPGGRDRQGRRITSNTVSVVVKVSLRGDPIAIFAGDIDAVGLDHLASSGVDIAATALIFPHHGGLAGSIAATESLTRTFLELVGPQEVLISNGRRTFDNPRPEVMRGILAGAPTARIACTQLSERCGGDQAAGRELDFSTVYANGAAAGTCCAGSIRVTGGGAGYPSMPLHEAFVDTLAGTTLCRVAI